MTNATDKFTEDQIITIFAPFDAVNVSVPDELDAEYVVMTRDSIDQIKENRKEWASKGELYVSEPNRLVVLEAQKNKGESRKNLHIVDAGEFRLVHTF